MRSHGGGALLLGLASLGRAWQDAGFLEWFADELAEVHNVPLRFNGTVPAYVAGTFTQTGPGRFTFGKERFTHLMDGFSKTNTIVFSAGGKATYTAEFFNTTFLRESVKEGTIARGIFVGPLDPPKHWGPTAALLGKTDNQYIKVQKVGNTPMLLADTTVGCVMRPDYHTFDHDVRSFMQEESLPGHTWNDRIEPLGDACMLGTMAHGVADPETGVFTGAMGCFGLRGSYHVVFTIEPSAPETRKLLAQIPLPFGVGASYMHAFGWTQRHIVLLAEPLYMNMGQVLLGTALGKGGLETTGAPTLFQIVSRKDGSVRTLEAPGFIFGHILNTFEDGGDILLDLTWYAANDMKTLGWFNRFFHSNMQDRVIRDAWPHSKVMRYRLGANGTVSRTRLFAEEQGRDDFETPKINERYMGMPYCIVYMTQFHSYEYDRDSAAMEPGPMGAVGVAKRNLCTGERSGWYRPNHYPSEVQFVPDPAGAAEDDGVLVGLVFDADRGKSYVQVLDARTMAVVATAPLPVKVPFPIHSSFFPASTTEMIV
mmetsp:Transcript_94371/g.266920  ORF Transcript_94371/g.266920 Transcript_94371/m.266920 type:complete len:539 (-) Transcript_94371:140-1756(-)